MKLKKYKEFTEKENVNESLKNVVLGSILAIQGLISNPIQASDQVVRKGIGGIHSNFDRKRTIGFARGTDRYDNKVLYTRTSSKNYSNLYNKLLNDLDSIKIQDSTLLSIKKQLIFSDQTQDLNIPNIIDSLKIVATKNNLNDILPILNNLENYSSQDLRDLSKSDAEKLRSQLEMVLSDISDLLKDEEPFHDSSVFIPLMIFCGIILFSLFAALVATIRGAPGGQNPNPNNDEVNELNPPLD